MHLKSIGALCARTLSYESCNFELVDGISDKKLSAIYDEATGIWTALHSQLLDRCTQLKRRDDAMESVAKLTKEELPTKEMLGYLCRQLELHQDSDSESDQDEDVKLDKERRKLRMYKHQLELHQDSDSESDQDEDVKLDKERRLRRQCRARKAKSLPGKGFDSSLIIIYDENDSFILTFIHQTSPSPQDCTGLLIRGSFGVFVLQARLIPLLFWLRKH